MYLVAIFFPMYPSCSARSQPDWQQVEKKCLYFFMRSTRETRIHVFDVHETLHIHWTCFWTK